MTWLNLNLDRQKLSQIRWQKTGVIFSFLALFFLPLGIPSAHALINQPCTIENLDPVCDTCNGELCHNFGDQQNPDLRCAAARITGFVGNDPVFSFGTQPTDDQPQCPGGQLLNVVRNATDAIIDLPDCWNSCSTAVFTTNKQGYFNFLGPVCSANTTFCQDISGGDQSNDCRTGECTSVPTFDSNNPTGCDYALVPEDQDFTCALCSNAVALDVSSCGNGICEGSEGEDCQSCPVDCVIPGFEDTCPLTSGPVIEAACVSGGPVKKTTFGGPPYNRSNSQKCEDGDLCTDNQCSSDKLSCESTPKACSGDLSDFCCPANCQAPADGTVSCNNATDCDVDCFAPKECVAPTPVKPSTSNLCLSGSGIGMNGGQTGSCATCSLNKTATYPNGTLPIILGWALGLGGLFISLRRGSGLNGQTKEN
jgi:hypothetical protein